MEELLQEKQAAGAAASGEMNELVESIFKILYATESAAAEAPEDDSASASANPVPAAAVPAVATELLEPQEV